MSLTEDILLKGLPGTISALLSWTPKNENQSAQHSGTIFPSLDPFSPRSQPGKLKTIEKETN